MSMSIARTVNVRFLEGDLADNRVGKLQSGNYITMAFPRKNFGSLKKSEMDIDRPGAYLLIGALEFGKKRNVYVGESSRSVGGRIYDHNTQGSSDYKEFWETAVVLTTIDEEINSVNTKYIENELRQIIEKNIHWKITNKRGSTYSKKRLSHSGEDFIIDFAEANKIIVTSMGYDLLREPIRTLTQKSSYSHSKTQSKQKAVAKFTCRGLSGIYAEMIIDPSGEFIVIKDSIASGNTNNALPEKVRLIRDNLISTRVLKKKGDNFIFTKDHSFDTVSAAASLIKGSRRGGKTEWRLNGGKITYKQWQEDNKNTKKRK